MKTTSRFEKFLINRNLLEKFKHNLKNRTDHSIIRTIPALLILKPPTSLISSAFIWDNSPEGHSFWGAVDEDWRRCLKNDTL